MKEIRLSQAPGGPPGDDLHTVIAKIQENFTLVGSESLTVDDLGVTVASLNGGGTVPSHQLPSYVDDVLEFETLGDFPDPGEDGKIYVSLDENLTYRWSGSQYTEISKSVELGVTATTAYRGDRGKIAYDHSEVVTGNPHSVTAAEVGLGNVTDDAQLKAADLDTDALLAADSDVKVPSQKAVKAYVDAHTTDDNNPHGVTKAQVGLGNVTDDAQLKVSDLDDDAALAANSDEKVPSQKAVKSYVDGKSHLPVVGSDGDVLTVSGGSWTASAPVDPLALRVVIHDNDPDVARPTAISVRWIGSVEPNNAIVGDEWVDNA